MIYQAPAFVLIFVVIYILVELFVFSRRKKKIHRDFLLKKKKVDVEIAVKRTLKSPPIPVCDVIGKW